MQTEEGHSHDAVETYLQILELQEDEDPYEVADAHFQASDVRLGISTRMKLLDLNCMPHCLPSAAP